MVVSQLLVFSVFSFSSVTAYVICQKKIISFNFKNWIITLISVKVIIYAFFPMSKKTIKISMHKKNLEKPNPTVTESKMQPLY